MVQYTDKTLMPFGKFKGVALANVPASYLLWLLDNAQNLSVSLKQYIEENREGLKKEAKAAAINNAR